MKWNNLLNRRRVEVAHIGGGICPRVDYDMVMIPSRKLQNFILFLKQIKIVAMSCVMRKLRKVFKCAIRQLLLEMTVGTRAETNFLLRSLITLKCNAYLSDILTLRFIPVTFFKDLTNWHLKNCINVWKNLKMNWDEI